MVEECILDFDEYDKGGASNLTAQMSGSWMTSPLGIIVFFSLACFKILP